MKTALTILEITWIMVAVACVVAAVVYNFNKNRNK